MIAPLSTLGHWQRELEAWSHLNVEVYHGNAAARQVMLQHEWWFDGGGGGGRRGQGQGPSAMYKFNVVVTTYEMINLAAAPNEPSLSSMHWRCLVVDEAHRLKNAKSQLLGALEGYAEMRSPR